MPAASLRRLRALALPPGAAFAEAIEQAWADGDVVLPLDPEAPPTVRDSIVAALRPDQPIEEDDAALVIATSGSTGQPKGVVLTHNALAASAAATFARIGLEDGDRWLSCLPWHHIAGLQVMLRARLAGTPVVVHDGFDVDRVAGEPDVTLVSLVPTQLTRLLDAGADVSRFRVILLGGAAAPAALLDRAAAAGARVVTTYGMSETAGGCVYDGVPLDGVDVATDPPSINRAGRIRLRGPMLMSGYRLRPDLTATAIDDQGWFTTGDLGRWDGHRLVVHGRGDDVIITGGEKVAADAVAGTLAQHPAVHDVVVVGVPDGEWGERVVAVVVPTSTAPTLDELRTWIRDRIGAAAAPRELVLVAALPRLSSGKTDRLAARSLVLGPDQAQAPT